MKIAIVFYSFSGNTRNLARFIKATMSGNEIELIDLKLAKEERNFFVQCKDAAVRKKPELVLTAGDFKKYELIIFASPVWAYTFAPAMRTFLSNVEKLDNKKAAIVLTCGSGLGIKKALEEMKKDIEEKGASVVFSGVVPGHKCTRAAYLNMQLKTLFELSKNN